MPGTSDLVSLILLLAQALMPDELAKLGKELSRLEEEHEKHAAAVKDALAAGDVDALNQLLCVHKAETQRDLPFPGPSGGAG